MANNQSNSGLDQCHDCGVRRKQVANPTTNYGFVLPTPTDLVTDLPADFDVALQGVDTQLKALQPGTTLGDLAYSSATANTNTRLPIGTTGQVLAVVGGVPAWATTADQTPLTTKGDLFTFDTEDARLGVGANGTILTADSAEATGLKWAAAAGGGKVLQVIQGTTTSQASVTSTSYIPTGITATITPSSATSKVLVIWSTTWAKANTTAGGLNFKLKRTSTYITYVEGVGYDFSTSGMRGMASQNYLDSPATTSATTYVVDFANFSGTDSNSVQINSSTGTITLMEIGA